MVYLRFFLKRLLLFVPTLIGATLLIFSLLHLAPGSPVVGILGTEATPELIERLTEDLGLDKPIHIQYYKWLSRIVHGEFGHSYLIKGGANIGGLIRERLPKTFELAGLSFLWAVIIGIPLGVISAVKENTWIDSLVRVVSLAGVSIPYFWTGILAILIFGVYLGQPWAYGGYVPFLSDPIGNLLHMLFPSVILGSVYAALLARMTRSSMIDILTKDYILAAEAMGIKRYVIIMSDAFRNAFLPVLTLMGMAVGLLLRGSVMIEAVFNIPGLGNLIIDAGLRRDFPVLQASLFVVVFLFLVSNLIVDMLYGILNPKITYE